MKIILKLFAVGLVLTSIGSAFAGLHYVDLNSTNSTPPYVSWATAATNIQDAVDASLAEDEIVVTNGIYASSGRATVSDPTFNRVTADKPLSLRSANGPLATTIDGRLRGRCVYLSSGARLSGFTLTGGAGFGQGGGLFCEAESSVVSNCIVSGNVCYHAGLGGGVYGGTLNQCTLSSNFCAATGVLCKNACGWGGGAAQAILNNCTIAGNNGAAAGGGAFQCTLNNCTLIGNVASMGGGASGCKLNNCTLTGNSAEGSNDYAGLGGGAVICTLNNCIVYFNTSMDGPNYDSSSMLNYSCTTPQPTNGVGNITNAPLFVDLASGDFRLQPTSPCVNAGLNVLAPAGPDLDGYPRISGGTVDMGAYEVQLAPRLTILRSGKNLVLTWPPNAAAAGLTYLETTTNLSEPFWTEFNFRPATGSSQNVTFDYSSDTAQFYRLRQGCPDLGPRPGPDWILDLASCHWIFHEAPGISD